MDAMGYNTAETQLVNAIISNGHTVTVNSLPIALPAGFVSTCVDPVNGYDWLCFFGSQDFTSLTTQIKTFIDSGGKVFYQYEVSCCDISTTSVASILSSVTGLTITPNANPYVALGSTTGAYSSNNTCCTFTGNAYRGLDGVPSLNQLTATASTGTPAYTVCPNFGFHFSTTEFVGTAHNGAFCGMGDVNIWYNADEPFGSGGSTPVNMNVVDYFFPNTSCPTCSLYPKGCLLNGSGSVLNIDLGIDTLLCTNDTLILDVTTSGATYTWQDGSSNSTFQVTGPGVYSVSVQVGTCLSASDNISITYHTCDTTIIGPTPLPGILTMPNVLTPNNDDQNDLFVPILMENISSATLLIYNRWGQKLFETSDLKTGWNGKTDGKNCPDGVYFWILDYTDNAGTRFGLQGSLSLLQ